MKTKPRRKWRADPKSFSKVIALTELFNATELAQLLLPIRISFQALLSGQAMPHDIGRLIDTANVTLVRCWGNADLQPIAQTALDALKRCYERYERLGAWGLDGPARADIEQGLELHEELCRLSTPRQMRDAALKVERMKESA